MVCVCGGGGVSKNPSKGGSFALKKIRELCF